MNPQGEFVDGYGEPVPASELETLNTLDALEQASSWVVIAVSAPDQTALLDVHLSKQSPEPFIGAMLECLARWGQMAPPMLRMQIGMGLVGLGKSLLDGQSVGLTKEVDIPDEVLERARFDIEPDGGTFELGAWVRPVSTPKGTSLGSNPFMEKLVKYGAVFQIAQVRTASEGLADPGDRDVAGQTCYRGAGWLWLHENLELVPEPVEGDAWAVLCGCKTHITDPGWGSKSSIQMAAPNTGELARPPLYLVLPQGGTRAAKKSLAQPIPR